ncbi:YkgJ family cysteine cluster protein [Desulfolucanica intricata]|uniref:YkgJ family cysteine cluster protein n=1 Tax=Desulfolucanica intricata TaxID=1285191 RepID=UPI000833EADE|nr:YkgJ family cysteine cluster protein [Desulfolucanica intricata]
MLPQDKIYILISQAETEGIFKQLHETYDKLPDTSCEQCGNCCTVPPPSFMVEYLNIYRYLKNNLQEQIPELIKRTARFYFLELADISLKCPFLNEENQCIIYPVRPFSCRGYGLLPNKDAVLGAEEQMKVLAQKYRELHGIHLPPEIVNFRLPQCDKIKLLNKKNINRQKIGEYLGSIGKLDTLLLPLEIVETNRLFVPVATHLAITVLSKGAQTRRIKIMKEYLETGKSNIMEDYIEKASSIAL